MQRTRHSGFTLIELAVVLVVIGFIVGGILVGKDLIATSQMRAEMTQLEKWTSAIGAFNQKYNCLPGDCAAIKTYFPSATPGNGNGIIETLDFGVLPLSDSEAFNSFVHLSLAGLIPGTLVSTSCAPGIGIPASVMVPTAGYTMFTASFLGTDTTGETQPYIGDGNIWFRMIGGASNGCSTWTQNPAYWGLTGAQIYQMDVKFDDGLPFTGGIRVGGTDDYSQGTAVQTMCETNISSCGVLNWSACTSAGTYQQRATTQSCPLLKRAD